MTSDMRMRSYLVPDLKIICHALKHHEPLPNRQKTAKAETDVTLRDLDLD